MDYYYNGQAVRIDRDDISSKARGWFAAWNDECGVMHQLSHSGAWEGAVPMARLRKFTFPTRKALIEVLEKVCDKPPEVRLGKGIHIPMW